MRERQILFKGEMVRAILDGRKTMTRRVVKENPRWAWKIVWDGYRAGWYQKSAGDPPTMIPVRCPYGQPGNHLWVRETWGVGTRSCPQLGWVDGIEYRADEEYLTDDRDSLQLHTELEPDDVFLDDYKPGWHASIHMPRWASRLTLEVINVRVERLQEITEADAIAEGVRYDADRDRYANYPENETCPGWDDPRRSFRSLWDEINGKKYPWESNPWVWVVEFRRIDQ